MKILVIPDVHLKPWILDRAEEVCQEKKPDATVFLGDIADDWGQQRNIGLYEDTYDRVIKYCKDHNDNTWFCYGNHDLSYLWRMSESGYSPLAEDTVKIKLDELRRALPEGRIGIMHCVGGVLFSHAGLTEGFARLCFKNMKDRDKIRIAQTVNEMNACSLWYDGSPIWARPQHYQGIGSLSEMWPPNALQVVGHTPTEGVLHEGNLLSCDTFSTYSDGSPIGKGCFIILDTETKDYEVREVSGTE